MKVSFRPIEKEDLPLLRDWGNQKMVRRNSHGYKLLNMVNQLDWFEQLSRSKDDEMFLVLVDEKAVGICGLSHINWKDRYASVTYYLGVQTNPAIDVATGIEVYEFLKERAFKICDLNRLWGEAFSFNEGGIKLALKCGFKQEGILRQHVFWNGKYWDSIIVGMLAEEYFKKDEK